MIMEWDDLGASHVISDKCRSHDCRDKLDELHAINSNFKATLFAIPFEMTLELLTWCKANESWISLGLHGLRHTSNYECEKWTYADMDYVANLSIVKEYFDKVFRAPGWQISDDVMRWLADNDWILCDQGYNDERRPAMLKAYINNDGNFTVQNWDEYDEALKEYIPRTVEAYHGHVWDVGWNGIYEDFNKVAELVKEAESFQFIKELF